MKKVSKKVKYAALAMLSAGFDSFSLMSEKKSSENLELSKQFVTSSK